jgi:hypothetical protein
MDGKKQCNQKRLRQAAGHSIKKIKAQQAIRPMKHQIDGMMAFGVCAKQRHIQRVADPCQGVPVTQFRRGKRLFDSGQRQSFFHHWVIENISGVINREESIVKNSIESGIDKGRQQTAGQQEFYQLIVL